MNRTPLQKLLVLKMFSGGKEPQTEELTETGNPATFTTDVKKPLTGLTIPFTPNQSGTGDPSPDNVRQISGLTGINVYQSGEDTSAYNTYAVTFPAEAGTVYGGKLDYTTGVLSIEYKYIVFNGSENWKVHGSSASWFYLDDPLTSPYVNNSESDFAISNKYVQSKYSAGVGLTNGKFMIGAPAGTNNRLVVKETSCDTVDAFKESLQSANLQVCYKISTPVTYQVTDQAIKTLIGTNVIWSNTNGTNTIKYLKKVST